MHNVPDAKLEVILAGSELVDKGLVARTWGNVSCRVDEQTFVITPSGIGYERLVPEFIVPVNIKTKNHEGDVRPSSEKGIHAAVYAANPDVNFIIHTHQTYATCISVAGFNDLAPTEAEQTALGGPLCLAAYAMPGTDKLKNNVVAVLNEDYAPILMERHGALIMGKDRAEAFDKSVIAEEVCRRAMHDIEYKADKPLAVAVNDAVGTNTPDRKTEADSPGYSGDPAAEEYCKAIFDAYHEITHIAYFSSPSVLASMSAAGSAVPAILDDYAQMVGIDAKVARKPKETAKKRKGRNAVFIKGLGVLCCAGSPSDCDALMMLVEKNAMAYRLAQYHGKVKPISYIERRLMRHIYVTKYSKKK
jgi:L-fuculose-phosphate aldolase